MRSHSGSRAATPSYSRLRQLLVDPAVGIVDRQSLALLKHRASLDCQRCHRGAVPELGRVDHEQVGEQQGRERERHDSTPALPGPAADPRAQSVDAER